MKRYGVILCDPPWPYSVNKGNGVAENHYSTMGADDLRTLEIEGRTIEDLAADDAILLLWTTWPFLPFAVELVDVWGFEYVTGFPWVKIREIGVDLFDGQPVIGTQWGVGFWARSCSEPLLVARRGEATSPDDPPLGLITSREGVVLLGPRLEHSRKLDTVYEYAELFPGPYLELFARRRRPGWDCWGNEVDSTVELEVPV